MPQPPLQLRPHARSECARLVEPIRHNMAGYIGRVTQRKRHRGSRQFRIASDSMRMPSVPAGANVGHDVTVRKDGEAGMKADGERPTHIPRIDRVSFHGVSLNGRYTDHNTNAHCATRRIHLMGVGGTELRRRRPCPERGVAS